MNTLALPLRANARPTRTGLAATAAALMLASTVPAVAQPAWPKSDGDGWTFYGQINQAYLNYDDSVESRGFFTVDNANNLNGSNFGFLYDGELDSGVGYSGRFQLAVTPRPSNEVSLQNPAGVPYELDAEDITYLEIAFQQTNGARLYFGQGDMTANLSAPDYSGTTIIAGPNVSQIAGDMLLRFENGTLSNRTLSDAIGTFDSGRKFRLRYDSRSFNGFAFSGSIGQDLEDSANDYTDIDAQVSYEGQIPNWRYAAVLDITGIGDNEYAVMASLAFMHSSGLNFTTTQAKSQNDKHYYYIKMGYLQNVLSMGPTAFSVEWYNNGDWIVQGSEAQSIGVSLVQYITRYDLQIYAAYRNFEAYQHAGLKNEDFRTGDAVIAGLAWEF